MFKYVKNGNLHEYSTTEFKGFAVTFFGMSDLQRTKNVINKASKCKLIPKIKTIKDMYHIPTDRDVTSTMILAVTNGGEYKIYNHTEKVITNLLDHNFEVLDASDLAPFREYEDKSLLIITHDGNVPEPVREDMDLLQSVFTCVNVTPFRKLQEGTVDLTIYDTVLHYHGVAKFKRPYTSNKDMRNHIRAISEQHLTGKEWISITTTNLMSLGSSVPHFSMNDGTETYFISSSIRGLYITRSVGKLVPSTRKEKKVNDRPRDLDKALWKKILFEWLGFPECHRPRGIHELQ